MDDKSVLIMDDKSVLIMDDELLMPRDAGRYIAERSVHVTIDEDSVDKTARKLAEVYTSGKFSLSGWKEEKLHPHEADENAIQFIFVMDTLNFCFWPDTPDKKFKVEYDGASYTGYWSLLAAMKRAQNEGKPICDAKFMATVGERELRCVFRSDSETDVPLLKERVETLNDAGLVLMDKFDGLFANCVRSCNKDALVLLRTIVDNFKSFRDVAKFEDKSVAFYKRAQILIADVWSCFEGKGLGEFHNIEALTMFADYRVPQALEYFGILRYSTSLKNCLESLTTMESGSRFELEIRGCSIEAVERLKDAIMSHLDHCASTEAARRLVNSITVDFYLWDYAKAHQTAMQHLPCHRVRTNYY